MVKHITTIVTTCLLLRSGSAAFTFQTMQQIWTSELDAHSHDDALLTFQTESDTHFINLMESIANGNLTGLYPYIGCHMGKDLKGYDRALLLGDMAGVDDVDANLHVLYNTEQMSCFLLSVPSTFVPGLHHIDDKEVANDVAFHPVTSYMKMREGLMSRIEEIADGNRSDEQNALAVSFCPGIIDDGDELSAEELGEELMLRMQQRDANGKLEAVKSFVWSGEHHDAVADSSSSSEQPRGLRKRIIETPRHMKKWKQALIMHHQQQCQNVFDVMFLEHSGTTSIELNMPHDFGDEQNSEVLAACMLALAAGLSMQPEICSLEKVIPSHTHNDMAQWILQSGETGYRPFFDVGLNGEGQIVAVSDSGLDTNNCYFWDSSPGELRNNTVQMERRKVIQYYNYQDDTDVYDGHGTHVSGTIVGRKSSDGITEDDDGIVDGVAYAAKISFFDAGLGENCCYIPGTGKLFKPSYEAGARAHSISWGSLDNTYSSQTRKIDSYIFDQDDYLVTISAGNYGNDNKEHTVGAPGTAKNVITVGASESYGQDLYSYQLGIDYLAYFSSRGPTSDMRAKPDVVGPGFNILSASSHPDEVGECDPLNITDLPSVGGDTSAYGVSYKAGTSMSTPGVSGIALQIQQYFQEGYYPTGTKLSANAINSTISAALIKAIIMNGAQSLKGVDLETPVSYYDNNQGYGRVNLLNSVPLLEYNDFSMIVTDRAIIANDEVHMTNITITNSSSQCSTMTELSVTLAWTDPAGTDGCTACLVNDLDLTVVKRERGIYDNDNDTEQDIYYANGRSDYDTLNNVERVRVNVNATVGGEFMVRVEGSNLATLDQMYALVITGCFDIDTNDTYPLDMKELVTIYDNADESGGGAGNMFDVVALNSSDIEILEMDIHTGGAGNATAANYTVMIYTKEGSYVGNETDADSWTLITDADGLQVMSAGPGTPTTLPIDAFAPIVMAKNTTLAFYVTLTTPDINYSEGTEVGSVYASNADLQILEGAGVEYPFASYTAPRVWNGALRYRKVYNDTTTDYAENTTTFSGGMYDNAASIA